MEKINISQSQVKAERTTKDFLENVKLSMKFRYLGYIGFGLLTLILKVLGIYSAPWLIFLLLAFLVVYSFFWEFLLKKIQSKTDINKLNLFYFIVQLIEVTLIIVVLHLSGVMGFIAAFALIVYFFHSYFPYTKRFYYWALLDFCILGYITTLTLEYLGILETKDFYNIGITVENNFGLFIIAVAIGAPLMLFMVLSADSFIKRLQNSLKELSQKEKELQEAKKILEIRVKARTRELEEERASLEEKIGERTKKLQEKLEELERFHKLAVGRELKMVELKKEIKKIKAKFKK